METLVLVLAGLSIGIKALLFGVAVFIPFLLLGLLCSWGGRRLQKR